MHAESRIVKDPGPHDAATAVIDEALGGEEGVVDPAHLFVERGMKGLVLPIAEIIAAAEPVADAEQHVLVAEFEHVGARDVLVDRNALNGVGQQIVGTLPPFCVRFAGLTQATSVLSEIIFGAECAGWAMAAINNTIKMRKNVFMIESPGRLI